MTTVTSINIAESTIAATSPTKTIRNDEAACYLYFTPIPGTSSVGIHDNTGNKHKDMIISLL